MDYRNISDAVSFYTEKGYVYVDDAPWIVHQDAYFATKPKGATDIQLVTRTPNSMRTQLMGYPVASGEQSFIQMIIDGQPIKRAICVTPCFRHEPRIDALHRKYFMKAELINAQDVDLGHLIHMIHDACSFFERYVSVRVIETPMGYDIVEKGTRFELGSYGIRSVFVPCADGVSRDIKWIYGTACAEPRLSTAIEKSLKHVGR